MSPFFCSITFSLPLGIFIAFRLLRLKNTKILDSAGKTLFEAQRQNREFLEHRFGESLYSNSRIEEGGDLLNLIGRPSFAAICFSVVAIMIMHPESMLHYSNWLDLHGSRLILMIGQVLLSVMFICSVILMVAKRFEK